MADIAELVVRLRALALKFDKLGTFTGEYFYEIYGDAVVDANALVEEIYDAGFLLSIEKMDEVRNIIEASGPHRSLTKMFLFDLIIGFRLIPQSKMIEEVAPSGRDELREYWFLEPGLLKQKAIHVEDRRTIEYDDFQKRHGFELCDRCARGCEMLIEVIEREMAAQKPIQQADDGDGFSLDKRCFRWRGKEYYLNEKPSSVIEVLYHSYLNGNRFLHEQYIKVESEVESDIRTLVRDNALSELIVRRKDDDGKNIRGFWGLSTE